MGYNTSNAALAYDMNAMPAYVGFADVAGLKWAGGNLGERKTPRFDVYTGAGRQANQAVSPVFMSVLKTFCIIAAIFMTIGVARVALAGVTAQVLNSNAALTNTLEKATDESSDLEVMHSVYGADTRIRDLAAAYGMVEPSESVTLDFSQDAAAGASSTATAQ